MTVDILEAVRPTLPPDPTPWTFGAVLFVVLALRREVAPARRRRAGGAR